MVCLLISSEHNDIVYTGINIRIRNPIYTWSNRSSSIPLHTCRLTLSDTFHATCCTFLILCCFSWRASLTTSRSRQRVSLSSSESKTTWGGPPAWCRLEEQRGSWGEVNAQVMYGVGQELVSYISVWDGIGREKKGGVGDGFTKLCGQLGVSGSFILQNMSSLSLTWCYSTEMNQLNCVSCNMSSVCESAAKHFCL